MGSMNAFNNAKHSHNSLLESQILNLWIAFGFTLCSDMAGVHSSTKISSNGIYRSSGKI
jgi:hypothetical protein